MRCEDCGGDGIVRGFYGDEEIERPCTECEAGLAEIAARERAREDDALDELEALDDEAYRDSYYHGGE